MSKKKVLVTGGTGFVGSNALPILRERFEVLSPRRSELDATSAEAVERYVARNRPDVIVHLANPSPAKNALDDGLNMFEGSLDSFMACYRMRNEVERVVYLGSGAEYDKRFDIRSIREEEFGRSYPTDQYGAAKYVENELARASNNVINLRLFACYGPGDHWTKFITHCIRSIMSGLPLTIRQDCRFDYLHVSDLASIIAWAVEGSPIHHDYNVASGEGVMLSEIASLVCEEMGVSTTAQVLAAGLNKEYTASVGRLRAECDLPFVGLREGIERQIAYEKDVWPEGGYAQV